MAHHAIQLEELRSVVCTWRWHLSAHWLCDLSTIYRLKRNCNESHWSFLGFPLRGKVSKWRSWGTNMYTDKITLLYVNVLSYSIFSHVKCPLLEYIIHLNYMCNCVITVVFQTASGFVSLQSDGPGGKHWNVLSWWGRIQPGKVKRNGHKRCKRCNLTMCPQILENVVVPKFLSLGFSIQKHFLAFLGALYNLPISQNESASEGWLNESCGNLGQF